MIVIERSYEEENPRGGGNLFKVKRKCFADNDIEGVEKFINETPTVLAWTNVEYNYIKL